MRAGKVIAVVFTIMIGAPAVAGAQDRADDRVRQDAAALPERLWESASDPVSAAGPGLSEDDGGGVAPLLAGAILLASVGAGYGLSLLRPAAEPELAPVPSARAEPAPRLLAGDAETCVIALTTRAGGEEAEFVALARDESGNAQVMARSPRFARRAGLAVEESESAVAAHGTLLEDLEAHGWHVSGTLETWYGATLARGRRP
jgi:hypothetical protein